MQQNYGFWPFKKKEFIRFYPNLIDDHRLIMILNDSFQNNIYQ